MGPAHTRFSVRKAFAGGCAFVAKEALWLVREKCAPDGHLMNVPIAQYCA
jgi:hypothetical protein